MVCVGGRLALEQAHVARARTLGGILRLEIHALPFTEKLEHRVAHGTPVEEMFGATLVADEPESFVDEKTCDSAGRHSRDLHARVPGRMAERIPDASRPPERTHGPRTNQSRTASVGVGRSVGTGPINVKVALVSAWWSLLSCSPRGNPPGWEGRKRSWRLQAASPSWSISPARSAARG